MEFELWDDVAPAHVNSFRKLAQKGYFDGQALHPTLAVALALTPQGRASPHRTTATHPSL
eukprot:scaffold24219_cov43-Phaeocystis_antarctica.AAC.3